MIIYFIDAKSALLLISRNTKTRRDKPTENQQSANTLHLVQVPKFVLFYTFV